jgi:hypothetical protein
VSDHTSPRRFDLSRNKSLRTLETTGSSISNANLGRNKNIAFDFFKTILSSVTPSAPLDVVIIYRAREICGLPDLDVKPFCFLHSPQEIWNRHSSYYQRQLRMFCGIYKTRNFRLVLCADVPDFMAEHAIEILGRAVEMGKVMGGIGHLYEPLVICERRTHPIGPYKVDAGYSGGYVSASAL